MSNLVIIGIVFIIVCVVAYGLFEVISRRKQRMRDRWDAVSGNAAAPDAVALKPNIAVGAQVGRPHLIRSDIAPTLTQFLSGKEIFNNLRLEMHRAGLKLRPSEFVALVAVSMIGMAAIGLYFTKYYWMGAIMAGIGYIIPIVVLRVKQNTRRKLFDGQLVDALTLISSSLRTGYSFMHSCEMIINEMPVPIAEEFGWARGEASLGIPMEIALGRMVTRVKSYDLDLAVTAVNIQLQVGGNLAEILDTIAKTIRERIRIKGEINALTAEGKLSGVIVFVLPMFLGLFLEMRDRHYYDPLIQDPLGMTIIFGMFSMQILGGLIIKKMVDIDV